MLILTAAFATLALLAGSPALAQEAPAGVKVTAEGFNDAKDMPLYTYAADTEPNKSTCYDQCLVAWPALVASDTDKDMGDWTVVTRDGGGKPWAYKRKPLYPFFRDTAGQPATGVSAAWPRAKP